MPEALLCVQGKPDKAGGPVIDTMQDTWRLAQAGGHIVCNWEARQCGRPTRRIHIHTEAGLCRRPYCVYKGSPQSGRPGDNYTVKKHGGRSRPEAISYTTGKPGNAGGPLEGDTYTWKPVYAGGLSVTMREARRSGRLGENTP